MKKHVIRVFTALILSVTLLISGFQFTSAQVANGVTSVSLQKRVPSELDKGAWVLVNIKEEWNPAETAIIICDMWDRHWCIEATNRVGLSC